MINISEGLKILGEFKRLSEILDLNAGEQRWQLLQGWLADHPKYRKKLYHCLSLTPADAVPYLCRELGLDYDGLRLFDPNGMMLGMAQGAISKLQELYRERSAEDVKALLNEAPKPQKKRTVNR
jgi:hypothetical protein